MNKSDIIFYSTPEGSIKVEVILQDETVWLSQKAISGLFDVDRSVVTKHLGNIFKEKELIQDSVCAKFAHTAQDGKNYDIYFYNLDAIISVGYRVNSSKATQFRIWATKVLKEFMLKGFVLNEERLKQGSRLFGKDYFDELLERIREIRASERRFYQKITDIYAECSMDYDPESEITRTFYKTVQNKLHWAVTGQTAAEIISSRAKAELPNMGLTSWKKSPKGKILRSDITIAKNYLNEKEIKELNRVVSMYLDYAENQAERQILMKMKDWVDKLDSFLKFNDYSVLKDAGAISSKIAKKLAENEFDKYRIEQDSNYESDFDREIKKIRKDNSV